MTAYEYGMSSSSRETGDRVPGRYACGSTPWQLAGFNWARQLILRHQKGSAARWPTQDRLPREQATDCDKTPLCEKPYKIAASNISHRGERFPPPGVDAAKENGHADALLVSFRYYK